MGREYGIKEIKIGVRPFGDREGGFLGEVLLGGVKVILGGVEVLLGGAKVYKTTIEEALGFVGA